MRYNFEKINYNVDSYCIIMPLNNFKFDIDLACIKELKLEIYKL